VRGDVVAFVEVKFRRTIDDGHAALSPRTSRRQRAAADRWLATRPRCQAYQHRFDAILVTPWAWPHHLPGAM
jgi:putative endonuclease